MPPPPALRPYLAFAKHTARSLEAVARVVERDAAFRARVVAAVDEDHVGRAGWLWLARPAGWEEELAALESAAAAEAAGAVEARAERAATRRLAAAEAAVERAEAQVAAQHAELESLRSRLTAEQAARASAEARAAELEGRVDALTAARGDVVHKLKDVEARLVERGTELNALKARVRTAEAEVRRLREQPAASAATSRPVRGAPSGSPVDVGPAESPRAVSPPAAALDPAEVAAEVARAAAGAVGLSEALASLAHLLAGGDAAAADPRQSGAAPMAGRDPGATPTAGPGAHAGSRGPGASGMSGDAALPDGPRTAGAVRRAPDARVSDGAGEHHPVGGATSAAGAGEPPARVRRVPVALPGGLFDDTVEAAEHLLRTPGAVLVVDGYNVTMAGWPELGAADQRRRLLMAVSDLAARTATPVHLVFDGAEVEPLSVPRAARQLVRVRFSEPGVEADDDVIDLVARIPAATPVIVASSDKRVRAGARHSGANLVHARQLVALLRR